MAMWMAALVAPIQLVAGDMHGINTLEHQPAKVLAMAFPLVALCGAGAWATVEYHEQVSLSVTRNGYAWQARRYPAWRPLEPVSAPALEGRRLFVAGDSHAAAYRTMTSMVARQTGMEVRQQDRGGCSFVNLLRASPADCQDFIEDTLSTIEREARPGDIVLLTALRMPELRGFDWQRQDAQQIYQQLLAERTPAHAQAARDEAERVLGRLQKLGVQVVIDAPLPLFKAGAYRCSDWFNRRNPACAGGLSMPRADLEMLRAPQMALLDDLAARYPSLTVWDPLPLLCGPQTCSAVEEGEPLFFDESGYAQLSDMARYYIGGILKHAPSLLAFTNPSANSYHRLVPGFEAPVNLVYSQRNRSACMRIPITGPNPKAKRVEFRCPDPSANPYMAFAALLLAGLDGIQNKIEPPAPVDKDIYELPPEEHAAMDHVPGNLGAVLDNLEADHEFLLAGDVFTPDLIETWVELKRGDLAALQQRPHPYEFDLYYDI